MIDHVFRFQVGEAEVSGKQDGAELFDNLPQNLDRRHGHVVDVPEHDLTVRIGVAQTGDCAFQPIFRKRFSRFIFLRCHGYFFSIFYCRRLGPLSANINQFILICNTGSGWFSYSL